MITVILVIAAAVAGFVGGILVGRRNPQGVEKVVSTAEKAAKDIKS